MKTLTTPDKHQLAIARKTLKMDDTVARLRMLGGPNKEEAREIILRLTGKPAKE